MIFSNKEIIYNSKLQIKMSGRMPFTNYKILKKRMAEKNKGFWKVQSIHKLTTRLSQRFNTKDFIIMKIIQNNKKYIPPFISFSNESHKFNIKTNKSLKENYKLRKPFFITNENKKTINETKINAKKEISKKLYLNLYKDFPYEPYLYNELQFIYLQGNNKLIPRKFTEVIKDCFIMDKYNKFLKNKKLTLSKTQFLNNSKSLSKYTLLTNKSNNYNSEDKYFKSINGERSINQSNRNMSTKCKTENGSLEINSNYLGTVYDKFYKNKRSRKFNYLPSLENRHLTDID